MDTIDRIVELLNENDYTQKDLTDYLGIKKSVFSAWKNGTSKSYNKYLTQIAEFFNVSVEDIKTYELKNAAIQKHGFFWEPQEREEMKVDARGAISGGDLSFEQMVENAIIVFKALFSRSLESYNFSPKHVDFETYSAMLLNQGKRQRSIFGDLSDEEYEKLYNKLVDKFGKKEGIPEGTYYPYERYHHIENDESRQTIKKKNNDVTNEVKLIARKTKDLPEEDRKALLNLLNSTVDTFLKAKGIKND